MLLVFLLIFGNFLDNFVFKDIQNDVTMENFDLLFEKYENNLQRKIPPRFQSSGHFRDEQQVREISKNDVPKSNNLPKLVPLVFPPAFFEKEGRKIIGALEIKLKSVFGEFDTTKMENMDSPEALFEIIEKKDFHNFIVNFIVKNCIKYIKPKGTKTVEGITSRDECKKTCYQSQSTGIQFAQRIFQSAISKVTQEDLRFSFSQDPKKCFTYFYDSVKNEHVCNCLDKGYRVKVSPRLLELLNDKYFSKENVGELLVNEILEENPNKSISNMGGVSNLKKVASIFFGLMGFRKNDTRWYGYDYGYGYQHDLHRQYAWNQFINFVLKHFIITSILFFFCHCIWYFHIVYFGIATIGELINLIL